MFGNFYHKKCLIYLFYLTFLIKLYVIAFFLYLKLSPPMLKKVVLLDLENNMPTAKMLSDIVEHYPVIYFFNCKAKFEFALEDLTELSTWISSGQIVILDTPPAREREFEYAMIVGQLMALLEPETHTEVISAMPESTLLVKMMASSNLECSLIQIERESTQSPQPKKSTLPNIESIKRKPQLSLVKKYCDALGQMTGQPKTVESLCHSVSNILKIVPEKAQNLVGTLINLKIIRREEQKISVRKKVLKQWTDIELNNKEIEQSKLEQIDTILENLQSDTHQLVRIDNALSDDTDSTHGAQHPLFKNFTKIDPMQMEVIRKLHDLKTDKPKDIYALRDMLEQMFPESDTRLLLKELIEKGYIYWNGYEVTYSHEMYLN